MSLVRPSVVSSPSILSHSGSQVKRPRPRLPSHLAGKQEASPATAAAIQAEMAALSIQDAAPTVAAQPAPVASSVRTRSVVSSRSGSQFFLIQQQEPMVSPDVQELYFMRAHRAAMARSAAKAAKQRERDNELVRYVILAHVTVRKGAGQGRTAANQRIRGR